MKEKKIVIKKKIILKRRGKIVYLNFQFKH